jgi:glycogen(starch) synthase
VKLVLVTRFYPPDTGGGGIAAYARYVALGLLRRGHQVLVVSQLAPRSQPFQVVEGVPVHRITANFTSYRWTRLPIIGRHVRFLRDILYAWRVRQTLSNLARAQIPDVVEYADIDAEGLFHPNICPYVVKLHTPHQVLRPYYTSREVPYAQRGIELLEARTIRQADGISSPSHYLANKVAQLYRLNEKSIRWVPNPIDTDFFSPCAESGSGNPLAVLYVGRLEPLKGAMVFAAAIPAIARAVSNSRFIFLGADRASSSGGSQKQELEAFFEKEGLRDRVQFYGHAEPNVFRDFYRRATVCVVPSLFENCPYTLLEAMACGLPAVVSRAGGMTEMVDDGRTGVLFETGNADALAEATIALLQSPARRNSLGDAARQFVLKKYSLLVGAEATEQFYRNVIDCHG